MNPWWQDGSDRPEPELGGVGTDCCCSLMISLCVSASSALHVTLNNLVSSCWGVLEVDGSRLHLLWEVLVVAGPGGQETHGAFTPSLEEHPSARGAMQMERFFCPCPGKLFCFIFSKAGLKTPLLCGSLHTLASSLSREAVTFMNFCGWCCVSRLSYVLSRVMWETRFQLLFWFIPLVVYLFIFFPHPVRFMSKDLFGEICCITSFMLLNRSD